MDKMVKLRDRLLEFGGNIACMDLTDAHYDAIMERGQYFYGEGIHHTKGFQASAIIMHARSGRSISFACVSQPDTHYPRTAAGGSTAGW